MHACPRQHPMAAGRSQGGEGVSVVRGVDATHARCFLDMIRYDSICFYASACFGMNDRIKRQFPNLSTSTYRVSRAKVVAFAADERYRGKKDIQYVDAYHSANRYASSGELFFIVLPRTTAWSFKKQRLLLGRELIRLQGLSFPPRMLDQFSESCLGDMAGNAPFGLIVNVLVPTPYLGLVLNL